MSFFEKISEISEQSVGFILIVTILATAMWFDYRADTPKRPNPPVPDEYAAKSKKGAEELLSRATQEIEDRLRRGERNWEVIRQSINAQAELAKKQIDFEHEKFQRLDPEKAFSRGYFTREESRKCRN